MKFKQSTLCILVLLFFSVFVHGKTFESIDPNFTIEFGEQWRYLSGAEIVKRVNKAQVKDESLKADKVAKGNNYLVVAQSKNSYLSFKYRAAQPLQHLSNVEIVESVFDGLKDVLNTLPDLRVSAVPTQLNGLNGAYGEIQYLEETSKGTFKVVYRHWVFRHKGNLLSIAGKYLQVKKGEAKAEIDKVLATLEMAEDNP